MWIRRAGLVVGIVGALGWMASLGCGLFTFPVEGPKALVANTKVISITTDVVDRAGQPVAGVTASITERARAADLAWGARDEVKEKSPRTFDGTFTYSTFGSFAVVVTYSKEGYLPAVVCYSLEDDPQFGDTGFMSQPGAVPMNRVNTAKTPRSKVVMVRSGG